MLSVQIMLLMLLYKKINLIIWQNRIVEKLFHCIDERINVYLCKKQ